jgi:hypothetical protein
LTFAGLLPVILAPAALLHLTPSIATAAPAASPPKRGSWPRPGPEPRIAAASGMPAGRAEPGIAPASASVPSPLQSATPPIPLVPAPTAPAAEDAGFATGASNDRQAAKGENVARPAGNPRALGFQPYSNEERQQLRYNGIGADEIAAFARAGYANLTVGDLVGLHYNGISGRFVDRLRAAGFPPFSPAELMALNVNGVSASEIAALGQIGHATLSPADLIRLHYRGVTPRFADRLHSLGYDNLSAAALLSTFDTGIFPRRPRDDRRG